VTTVYPDIVNPVVAPTGVYPPQEDSQLLIDALLNFNEQGAHGYQYVSAPTVQALTGKPPISVQEFLTTNKAALIAMSTPGPS